MNHWTHTVFLLLVAGSVFVIAYSLLFSLFGKQPQMIRQLLQRLGSLEEDADDALSLTHEHPPGRQASPAQRPWLKNLLAGVSITVIGGLLTGYFFFSLLAGIGTATLPVLLRQHRERKRLEQFEEQLPEVLEAIIRGLRAGYPLVDSMRMVTNEMEEPIAGEFRQTCDEIAMGIELRQALNNMVTRVPSLPLKTMTTTMNLQRETGGNLAESLATISKVIRSRFRFQRQVRILTAESRLSGILMMIIPFLLFGLMTKLSPGYADILLHDPMGQQLGLTALGLVVIGGAWMQKILRIDI